MPLIDRLTCQIHVFAADEGVHGLLLRGRQGIFRREAIAVGADLRSQCQRNILTVHKSILLAGVVARWQIDIVAAGGAAGNSRGLIVERDLHQVTVIVDVDDRGAVGIDLVLIFGVVIAVVGDIRVREMEADKVVIGGYVISGRSKVPKALVIALVILVGRALSRIKVGTAGKSLSLLGKISREVIGLFGIALLSGVLGIGHLLLPDDDGEVRRLLGRPFRVKDARR